MRWTCSMFVSLFLFNTTDASLRRLVLWASLLRRGVMRMRPSAPTLGITEEGILNGSGTG